GKLVLPFRLDNWMLNVAVTSAASRLWTKTCVMPSSSRVVTLSIFPVLPWPGCASGEVIEPVGMRPPRAEKKMGDRHQKPNTKHQKSTKLPILKRSRLARFIELVRTCWSVSGVRFVLIINFWGGRLSVRYAAGKAATEEKHQIPSTKHRKSSKQQTPMGDLGALELVTWCFSEVWCLKFGVSRRS